MVTMLAFNFTLYYLKRFQHPYKLIFNQLFDDSKVVIESDYNGGFS